MTAPTLDAPAPAPSTTYACPCCIQHGCTCLGRQVTGTRCDCCARPELVTAGSQRGQLMPCHCGATAYPAQLP